MEFRLTSEEAKTQVGVQLLALCEQIIADGKLDLQEIKDLRKFLNKHKETSGIRAVGYLHAIMTRITADKVVDRAEQKELFAALKNIIPVAKADPQRIAGYVAPRPVQMADPVEEMIWKAKRSFNKVYKSKWLKAAYKSKWLKATLIVGFIVVYFGLVSPWPHYQLAAFRDRVSSYEGFVKRFPRGDYARVAKERIRILSEDDVWANADGSNVFSILRDYKNVYPDGKYVASATNQMNSIANEKWSIISESTSIDDFFDFKRTYNGAGKIKEANARIQELYNDWDWVREQDTLQAYNRFLERFPNHPKRKWIEKRIIDLEVQAIAAGEHGELPGAQPLASGGTVNTVEVKNNTGYELTVRYSGPNSKKLVIPEGQTQSVTLPKGNYKVAASVNASRVTNYYGTRSMQGGRYSSSFHITTSNGGASNLPRDVWEKYLRE